LQEKQIKNEVSLACPLSTGSIEHGALGPHSKLMEKSGLLYRHAHVYSDTVSLTQSSTIKMEKDLEVPGQ
jgi:hypothetical protein